MHPTKLYTKICEEATKALSKKLSASNIRTRWEALFSRNRFNRLFGSSLTGESHDGNYQDNNIRDKDDLALTSFIEILPLFTCFDEPDTKVLPCWSILFLKR